MSPIRSQSIARNLPSSVSAIFAVVTLSRPCASPMKCSERSAAHFTAFFSFRAATANSAYSRYGNSFVPKPPPTSGQITRILSVGILSTFWQRMSRRRWLPWLPRPLDLDRLDRVAGLVAGLGHHAGDGIADMAHLILGQDRVRRSGEGIGLEIEQARQIAEFPDVVGSQDQRDAGKGAGAARI